MIEQDTIRLLRECDAGIKMGISAIDEVMKYVKNEELKKVLQNGMKDNEELKNELLELLNDYHDDGKAVGSALGSGKDPGAMAKGMSWMKTNVKLAVNESDNVAADLITDGCNMGVKSLFKYLNQYKAADEKSKKLAKKLISIEEDLSSNLRKFL